MVTASSRRWLVHVCAGVAVVLAAAASYGMWWEAVDYRATSGEGLAMVWAIPPSVVSVVLLLWLVTALLDRDRFLAVMLLSVTLVVVSAAGAFAVFAATERYPTQGAVGDSPPMTAAAPSSPEQQRDSFAPGGGLIERPERLLGLLGVGNGRST